MNRGNFNKKRKLPPGMTGRKKIGTNDQVTCCTPLASGTCNGNSDFNQFALHVCLLLSFIEGEGNLNLNDVITSSEQIFTSRGFSLEKFEFMEFQMNTTISLIYKIFGLTNIQPYELYNELTFEFTTEENVLINTFTKWFSMGIHKKTILQCSSHIFGIAVSKVKHYYLFDPNVEGNFNSNGEQTSELYKCDNVSYLVQLILQRLHGKQQQLINNTKCLLIGVGTLQPLTSLELYVTSDAQYDRRRSAANKAIEKVKNISSALQDLHATEKILRSQGHKSRIRTTEEGRKKLNARKREYDERKREGQLAADWEIHMENQYLALNKV